MRYHGRRRSCSNAADPTHEVVHHSWLVENRLLFLFAVADTRGRDTDSMTRPEENLHFWKLAAEEAGCYERPYPLRLTTRFTFFHREQPDLHYVPYDDFACTATLMAGKRRRRQR